MSAIERRLSPDTARSLTDEVKGDASALRAKLLRLYEGAAHKALGYESWGAYYAAEFGGDASRGYQLLRAAEVADVLSVDHGPLAPAPSERVARELAPLRSDPPRLREAWSEAVEDHGPEPTAAQVREKVRPDTEPEPSGFDRWSEKTWANLERQHALTNHFWPAMSAIYAILSSRDVALEELRRLDRKTATTIADDAAHAIDLFTELRDVARRQLSTLEAVE